MAQFRGRRGTTNIPREDTQRHKKSKTGRGRGKKSAKFWALHPSGPHSLGPHPSGIFYGLGPTFWGRLWPIQFWPIHFCCVVLCVVVCWCEVISCWWCGVALFVAQRVLLFGFLLPLLRSDTMPRRGWTTAPDGWVQFVRGPRPPSHRWPDGAGQPSTASGPSVSQTPTGSCSNATPSGVTFSRSRRPRFHSRGSPHQSHQAREGTRGDGGFSRLC